MEDTIKFYNHPCPLLRKEGIEGGFIKQIPYFIDTTGDSVDALHEE